MVSFWWGPSFWLAHGCLLPPCHLCPYIEKRREKENLPMLPLPLWYELQHVNFQSVIPFFLNFDLTVSQNCPLWHHRTCFKYFIQFLELFCPRKNWACHLSFEIRWTQEKPSSSVVCPLALGSLVSYSRRWFEYDGKFLVHFLFPLS